ncbi:putative ATPase [Streptoalloteichus tenebrarius]|uniref:ATPase n=1 Tax=Streptoalloteichus tenebrarius (strain ATCC 17920 / DSM 40477 / JCM 4838 / CBS 697.72 / NBRC 16177 / NCIMB 11028 / NRRL B-12390 / A12253. 1 / ISP 5477) TaxID=1933 RepID=A0ABT1HS06_STRSD|nr:BTAD domain-containing putative transcriptional regulator [Streptoalloteichus tenebrarius]MCP2258299.1 putative ATPase [Streptoalloteichus tenebrarius]BFF04465.1 BTAD domain-containing putative transcriptional regulator [Streptoalloteichus tenebrarius]
MRFGVLGPLALWAEDGTPVRVPELKIRALLADLAANVGRPVAVDRLIGDVWGDDLPANPVAALQTKVSQLRRVLASVEADGRDLVRSRPPGYQLSVDPDSLDATRFRALTTRAWDESDPRRRAAVLSDALALWRGPAFADFADQPFVLAAARRLEEERMVAVEELAEARLVLGEHNLVVGELADLVARHPLRERLRAAQMRALYRAGRRAEALATYADLRARLAEELGLDPGADLVALHQAILRGDPVDASTPPPPPPPTTISATGAGSHLPAPPTELVGRSAIVAEVRAAFPAARLVTLVGPGGVGKTRVALECAAGMAGDFPDNARLVELAGQAAAPATTVDVVAEVVAATLDIRDDVLTDRQPAQPTPLADRIVTALRGRRMLLVLDNCEHVVEPVAELVDRLLRGAPDLCVLATSREALGLPGEVVRPVPPLDLPDPDHADDPAAVARSGAVRLFVSRASAAAPGFTLTRDNAADVATLCARLDGIPLALELAATRVRALGLPGLVSRLDDRFRVLTSGLRGVPPRQRTLRAVIDWSWELLTEPERAVLRRLSVHADSAALPAAEAVASGDGVAREDVLDLLARLVDRSLVAHVERPDGSRYRLLESVAEYSARRLAEAGEANAVRARHRAYHLGFAERAATHLRGHDQRRWLESVDAEMPNLRRALDDAVRVGAAEDALRLVNALAWYWFLRGRLGEAVRAFDVALAVPATPATDGEVTAAQPTAARAAARAWRAGFALLTGGDDGPRLAAAAGEAMRGYDAVDDPRGRAHAEWFLGFAHWGIGELSAGRRWIESSLDRFRRLGDRWGEAVALAARARLALGRGDLRDLERDALDSHALFQELGDRWGRLRAADMLCVHAQITGDYRRAHHLNRDALRDAEDLGLWTEVAYKLSVFGRIALLEGDFDGAAEYHGRALRLATKQSDRILAQFAELGLALGARRRGDLDTAEKHLLTWLDWNHRLDGGTGNALILAELGFVAEQRGDAARARRLHREGLVAARTTGDPRAVALALEGLGAALSAAGEHQAAARLLGTADALRLSVGAPLPPAERGDVDRAATRIRGALGPAGFTAAFREGAGTPVDEVVNALLADHSGDHGAPDV